MGSPDSDQVTDLVKMFLLYKLHEKFTLITGGLYRDDTLLLVKNSCNRQLEL